METAVKFDKVNKTFHLSRKQKKISGSKEDKVRACRDVSFTVNKGEIFGLLGPNGAGKTTSLRIAATLINADSGEVTINGISIKNDRQVRRLIAFLTNDLRLDENFTPNALFDFFSRLHEVPEEVQKERKKELFNRFGITKFAEVKVKDLSQGMRQKAAIAISLVSDPEIIIFDEPTNGLDIITAKVVTDYLVELKNRGKTIILSTHIMSLVPKLCQRVGIIIDGQVVLVAEVDQLLKEHQDLDQLFFDLYSQYGRAQ